MQVAIIGAGPAGLAVGYELSKTQIECHIYEAGLSLNQRNHSTPSDLGKGIGGAGLFSDGKFSYHPSATKLYSLRSTDILKDAYNEVVRMLKCCDIRTAPWPDDQKMIELQQIKTYPSYYGSFEERLRLIQKLQEPLKGYIKTNSIVTKISKKGGQFQVHYIDCNQAVTIATYDSVVIATGRFELGKIDVDNVLFSKTFQRYEFGVRLVFKSRHTTFDQFPFPDVKFIQRSKDKEVRTFCVCQRGELWNIEYPSGSAVSGRSDGAETEYDNFGLLIRYLRSDPSTDALWKEAQVYFNDTFAYYQPIQEFRTRDTAGLEIEGFRNSFMPEKKFKYRNLRDEFSQGLSQEINKAIDAFSEAFPQVPMHEGLLVFPAIEGIGSYLSLEQDELRMSGEEVFVVGDAVGSFRGIVPALVSGIYCGKIISNNHEI